LKIEILIVAAAVLFSACASRTTIAGRVGTAGAYCYTHPKNC
jgi:hypothetical protein